MLISLQDRAVNQGYDRGKDINYIKRKAEDLVEVIQSRLG